MLRHGHSPCAARSHKPGQSSESLPHQAGSRRDFGDDRGRPPDRDNQTVAADHRFAQSQGVSSRSRPSTNTCFRQVRQRMHRAARQRPKVTARRILSRSIRAGDAKATANDAVAQISSKQFLAGAPASARLENRRCLWGIPLGIEHHRAAATTRTGQADRAPGLVATGYRPDGHALISARASRGENSAARPAITPFGSLAGSFPDFFANHAGDGAQASPAGRNRELPPASRIIQPLSNSQAGWRAPAFHDRTDGIRRLR